MSAADARPQRDDLPKFPTGKKASGWPTRRKCWASSSPAIPLDKYADKIRNLTGVISIADALERKPPERRWGKQADPADEIQVAGMMQACACRRANATEALCAGGARRRHRQDRADLLLARLRTPLRAAEDRSAGPGPRHADGRGRFSAEDLHQQHPVARRRAGQAAGGIRIRISLDRATEEMFASLKSAADAAPGPGKVMIHLEKKGEYAVILEPERMSVAADRGWVERVEELVGKGTVQPVAYVTFLDTYVRIVLLSGRRGDRSCRSRQGRETSDGRQDGKDRPMKLKARTSRTIRFPRTGQFAIFAASFSKCDCGFLA